MNPVMVPVTVPGLAALAEVVMPLTRNNRVPDCKPLMKASTFGVVPERVTVTGIATKFAAVIDGSVVGVHAVGPAGAAGVAATAGLADGEGEGDDEVVAAGAGVELAGGVYTRPEETVIAVIETPFDVARAFRPSI